MNDTKEPRLSRRQWLCHTAQLSMAGAVALVAGCGKRAALVCTDPDRSSDSENSLRASLHYTEASTIEAEVCSGCGFYRTVEDNPCGGCDLLKVPVNPHGRCDSWSRANS